ncbi:hypothetical protein [Pseudomonas aeruginosa]|uniref:hypothetical protein n=1 Tax=Pseudomonas aeruginosa TaxID=287 RepID=UPI001C3FF3A1|nr:hypothetical protein [Pseudomonas aeruginosa]
MSNELTDVRCPCGAEFQADSYDAGFIAGSGMCQNCDAALPTKDICTCPSGNGSLRHPCPAHPAVEQAGGDERDFQAKGAQEVPSPVSKEYDRHLIGLLRKGEALPGHQEEAADEIERLRDWNDHLNNTVLPNILNPNFLMLMKGGERLLDLCTKDGKFIGVSLNDMKDVFDWMVTHARIAPDQAALAQPSHAPELAERGTQHRFSTTEQTCRHDFAGVWWNDNGETKTGRECRHCGFFVADVTKAQAEQAEAERPVVVARLYRSNDLTMTPFAEVQKPLPLPASDGTLTVDALMTVAQHERIVEARWNRAMDLMGEHVARISEKLKAERDAALARVAELERGKVYVEARQCDECQHGGINDSATGVAACHECDWTGPEPEEDRCPGCQRENCMAAACPQCGARYVLVASEEIAAPVAQAQHSVPGDIMRDAQRYRWLRDQQFYFSFSTENSDAGISSCTAGMSSRFKNLSWVDAAIDSAIAAAPGKEVGHE